MIEKQNLNTVWSKSVLLLSSLGAPTSYPTLLSSFQMVMSLVGCPKRLNSGHSANPRIGTECVQNFRQSVPVLNHCSKTGLKLHTTQTGS